MNFSRTIIQIVISMVEKKKKLKKDQENGKSFPISSRTVSLCRTALLFLEHGTEWKPHITSCKLSPFEFPWRNDTKLKNNKCTMCLQAFFSRKIEKKLEIWKKNKIRKKVIFPVDGVFLKEKLQASHLKESNRVIQSQLPVVFDFQEYFVNPLAFYFIFF